MLIDNKLLSPRKSFELSNPSKLYNPRPKRAQCLSEDRGNTKIKNSFTPQESSTLFGARAWGKNALA